MFGEDGRIQAILESLGIAYSGPGVMSSALCMDKELTKKIVETYGVRTAKGVAIRKVLDVGLARLTGQSWALAELAATRDLEIPYGWWGSLLSTGRI